LQRWGRCKGGEKTMSGAGDGGGRGKKKKRNAAMHRRGQKKGGPRRISHLAKNAISLQRAYNTRRRQRTEKRGGDEEEKRRRLDCHDKRRTWIWERGKSSLGGKKSEGQRQSEKKREKMPPDPPPKVEEISRWGKDTISEQLEKGRR